MTEILSQIKVCHQKILNSGSTCESVLCYALNVLFSGLSLDFNNFIKITKSDIELGISARAKITYEELVAAARMKCMNMAKSQKYVATDPQ